MGDVVIRTENQISCDKEEYDETTKLAIKACSEVGYDLEKTLKYRLRGFALAEETFYELAGLKHHVKSFVDSITKNIVESPMFPAEMRLMAKMLIANSLIAQELTKSGALEIEKTAITDGLSSSP